MAYKPAAFIISIILIIAPVAASAGAMLPVSGTLTTKDNTIISYDHYKQQKNSVIVICPGFFNSKANRWMKKAVDMVAQDYDVIVFDFRGHGGSSGLYTWSSREYLDLDAVLNYAVASGYKHIGILAFSLGAATAVNEAALRDDIESMVLISCPTSFQNIDYRFWEPSMFSDLKDNIDSKWEGKGAKFTSIFMKKEAPIDSVRSIKHTAMFFIQGDNDWVIKPRHAKRLYDAAATKKKLEIVKGGLHAERLMQFNYDQIKEMVLDWFSGTLNNGRIDEKS